MQHVVLPQAIRHMLPVRLTQTIILFQDISLVYVISGNDFMRAISKIAQRDGQLVLMYSFVAICYLTVSLALSAYSSIADESEFGSGSLSFYLTQDTPYHGNDRN